MLPLAQRICCEKNERGVFGQMPVARHSGTYLTVHPRSVASNLSRQSARTHPRPQTPHLTTYPVCTSSENPISAVPPTASSAARLYTALLPTQIDAPHLFLFTCTTR